MTTSCGTAGTAVYFPSAAWWSKFVSSCYGYSIDSTTYYRLWLLWQFILVIQTAMRAFVALRIAAGPSVLLRTCFDGLWVYGRPHAPFPRVLSGANVATRTRRTTTGCGRWSQVDNHTSCTLGACHRQHHNGQRSPEKLPHTAVSGQSETPMASPCHGEARRSSRFGQAWHVSIALSTTSQPTQLSAHMNCRGRSSATAGFQVSPGMEFWLA